VVERRPQNGSMGTWTLGAKGGRGWALEAGFLGGEGGSKVSERKRAASKAARRCQWRPDALEAALSLPDGINFWADAPRTRVYVISTWNFQRTG